MPSAIHEENGQWYFWEETWADRQGPFPTQEKAKEELDRYCLEVLGIDPKTLLDVTP